MGRADYYKPGSWNTVCYFCGFKRKGDEMLRYWQGFYVCPEHWEARQPQDFARSVPDNQSPPWSQPQPQWVFGLNEFITEDSATDFIAPNMFMTETGNEIFVTESPQ